jgi:RimJ/RimL family protein N-acetyltransferase
MLERISRVAAGPPPTRVGEAWLNFAVLLDGRPIGRIEATVQEPGIVEIAYVFGPADGGRGHATEAVGWLIGFLRERWPAADIYACLAEANVRSRRLVERLGFRRTAAADVPLLSFEAGDLVYVLEAADAAGA